MATEGGKARQLRQNREFDERRQRRGEADADHKTDGCLVGLVGPPGKQDRADRGKGDGERTARPLGDDPKQLDCADRDKGAPGVDQKWKPVRDAETMPVAPVMNCLPGAGHQ